jgi:pyridoxine kinase
MACILAISSLVARGHVGLSVMVPALQQLGHEVIGLPTVVLSNHPGHSHVAGTRIDPGSLDAMIDALDANGWLARIDGVITGYLPTVEHVAVAQRSIQRLRASNPRLVALCDPVLGDDPKGLYIPLAAAEAIGDRLVGLADIVTPNRFELAWLTGLSISCEPDAIAAAGTLKPATVLATSIPAVADQLGNITATKAGSHICRVPKLACVPHGTGDLLSALYLHHALSHVPTEPSLARAVGQLQAVIGAARGRDDLDLSGRVSGWTAAAPWPVIAL